MEAELIRIAVGNRPVIAELDIPFSSNEVTGVKDALNTLEVNPEIIKIQFQQAGKSIGELIGKYSLHQGYDLENEQGNKFTHLSSLLLRKQEIEGFQITGDTAATSNMHIVCY